MTTQAAREQVADYLRRARPMLERVASRRLCGRALDMGGVDDIYSSVCRRVLKATDSGVLRIIESEMERYAFQVARNLSCTRNRQGDCERRRLLGRLAYMDADGCGLGAGIHGLLERCRGDAEAAEMVRCMVEGLEDATDKAVFLLRLRGLSHRCIAEDLGMTEAAAKQRWKRLCDRLRERHKEMEP